MICEFDNRRLQSKWGQELFALIVRLEEFRFEI